VAAGDPCGIGPEVILRALTSLPRANASFTILGDPRVFEETARRLRLRSPAWRVISFTEALAGTQDRLAFVNLGARVRFVPGRSSVAAGRASRTYLDAAVALWRSGGLQGLVTAPVTKWAIQRSVPSFVGQTEYLAAALGVRRVAMMFASPSLKVVLLTRHVPMRAVSSRLTRTGVRETVALTVRSLREAFGSRHPRLAVCGLNPHAGEGGLFGSEERRVLIPVLRELRRSGVRLDGPVAADGLFAANGSRTYDAILCCYHDQGLIPFKMAARDLGCQLTLGLPFPRTSPDHGSALELAGRGVAHPGSMRYAITLAVRLAGAPRIPRHRQPLRAIPLARRP